ncbi:efflux RND transporter periplasmic adaptor subunit [Pseudorhodoplanes sp.]|uniref:efflux RND transporter periplasmic adaptor subunit n=1 Tax=Pseudorhodoplanes sp. TaxID=1934341 RepID=UPI002CCBB249|nr:HlyD family efflux transporter periplasmic adaptor subunit [Pseudorhodoplanes sp.]HWV53741.1 HlyD family efflux transporter periplasmic adaptor subunit [Pseudorhodoplanes sp.]
MRKLPVVVLCLAVIAAAALYFVPGWNGAPADSSYRTAKVDRGEVVATVSATGTINPTTTVIVGSQLSGQVVEILADYNSEVQAGQVVARLNQDQIRARLDAARADLAQMRAQKLVVEGQIEKVKAETEKARAAQTDMEAQVVRNEALHADSDRIYKRQNDLRTRGFAADAAVDTARATRDAQEAALASARAQVNSAKAALTGLAADLRVAQANLAAVAAQIQQREAAVRQIEVDLSNTEIKSPVSGVVVQRNVELGQTVAASLQAPELFRIADDLSKMEISANIDETDIGRIKPGQRVTFTVNAFPGRTFEGVVKQVRLGSQNVQNVVIYTTIVSIENPRRELLPGMTANLRVETERRNDVVRLPNAALRWRPAALADQPIARGGSGGPGAGAPGAPQRRASGGNSAEFLDAIKTEIKPGADQLREIEAAFADMRKSFLAGAGDGDASGRRERILTARRELEQRIAGILTPAQKSVFDEIVKRQAAAGSGRASQSARVFIVGRDGKPQGVTINTGVTDGASTEVVAGLEPGAEVIVGGTGQSAAAAQRSGPRFGF